MNKQHATIELPAKFADIFDPYDFKVFFGGRGSGKSMGVALHLMALGASETQRILCCREYQKSIDSSVHRLLVDINRDYNFGYDVTNKALTHPKTGSLFSFEGLKTNPETIKGMANYTRVWVEEADGISKESWDLLLPTIRAEGAEIIIVFNPKSTSDPAYSRFVKPFLHSLNNNGGIYKGRPQPAGPNYLVVRANFEDNPWFPAVLQRQAAEMLINDPIGYRHVYGGEPIQEGAETLISGEWFDACVDAHMHPHHVKNETFTMPQRLGGYDPADGVDRHAYVYRQGSIVKVTEQWAGDLGKGCAQAHAAFRRDKVRNVVYDVVGLGTGVKQILSAFKKSGSYAIEPFHGSSVVAYPHQLYRGDLKNKDVFKNRRAQSYTLLANRMENTFISLRDERVFPQEDLISFDSKTCSELDQLRTELVDIRRVRSAGRTLVQIESKVDMKRRGLKSPNLADALNYAFVATGDIHMQDIPTSDTFQRWI